MLIALVVYEGVLDDECEAFRTVLGLLRDAELVTVAADRRDYAGPGGTQPVDLSFDELRHADVVVVPGGLGCERAADDPNLREFLHRMERTARYLAGSSTGTVVLASAGLLHGASAATHWLASDLLRRYGSQADARRLVVTGNVITCEGRISAVDAAFTLVERLEGSAAVERIRATLLHHGQPLLHDPSWWERVLEQLIGRSTIRPQRAERRHDSERPTEHAPVTPLSVMVELVDDDDLARKIKQRAHRRQRS